MDEKLLDILDRHNEELKKYPHYLSAGVATKFVMKKDTGQPCITVYVDEKVALKLLASGEVIPGKLEDAPVDVVEFRTEDWDIGETGIGNKNPRVQRRMAGGLRK